MIQQRLAAQAAAAAAVTTRTQRHLPVPAGERWTPNETAARNATADTLRSFQLKVCEKRVRTSSPCRLPVSAMTRVELLAELTLAVPHASFQPAAPRNSHSRHSELGVQDRDDVKKARIWESSSKPSATKKTRLPEQHLNQRQAAALHLPPALLHP
jgi:hypothetical protein